MSDRDAAALGVACPICGVEPGELCRDVVKGCIGPIQRPHIYRTSVAAEVSHLAHVPDGKGS